MASGHLFCTGQHPAARIGQRRARRFSCLSRPARFGARVLRIARDPINFAAVTERQFHLGLVRRRRIIAAQHGAIPVSSTRLPVKGKRNGIENGRFSRTGIAGDEIQPALSKILKRHLCCARIGSKGAHHQFQRLHSSSPPSSIARTTRSISSSIGSPFCAS